MSTKVSGITIPIQGEIKPFLDSMKKVDNEINKTVKTVGTLQKSLEIEWDDMRFIETQKQAQRAIDDSTEKIRLMKVEFDRFQAAGKVDTKEFKNLQEEIMKSEANVVLLKKRLKEINDLKIKQLVSQFKEVGESISAAGQKMMALSAASAAALAGMTALFNSTVSNAAEIDDLSQSINLNAEAIQKWRYLAKQLGLDNGTLTTALSKTQAAFASMAMGEINASTQALQRLGFTAEEASKGMDVNFEVMIQKLSQVTDSTEQAYLANELFGDRLGSKVIPLLKGGADGLAKLSAEFEEIGYMSNEQVKSLADYDDQWNVIKQSFIEIKNQLAISLLPIFQQLTAFIQDKVVPAIRTLAEWFEGLSTSTKSTIATILAVVAAIAPVLLVVGKITSGIGGLINSVGMLSKALTFLMAHPILAIIGAVAALLIYLYTTNEKFRESVNGLVATLGESLAPMLEKIGALFGELLVQFGPILDLLGESLIPMVDLLSKVLKPVVDILGKVLIARLTLMVGIIKQIVGVFTFLANTIASVLIPVFEWLTKAFDDFMAFIPVAIENTLKFVETFVNSAITMINGLIDSINKIGNAIGINIAKIDKVKIQMQTNPGKISQGSTTNNASSVNNTVDNAVANNVYNNSVTNNMNYDNSHKNIEVKVEIQNYAEKIDVKDLTRRINLELAKQM